MKYIDADKLIANLERRKQIHKSNVENGFPDDANKITEDDNILSFITSLQQEQQEVNLEKFTEKMDAWKARYNYPDNISIKGTMAFTARMFYMYPKVAREWYDSLPKVTLD